MATLCVLTAAGCVTIVPFKEQERLECPEPPPPVCKPGSFNEITIDTSSAQRAFSSHHLAISRVSGLDTKADEFSVAFGARSDGRAALATIREKRGRADRERDQIVQATFTQPARATLGQDVPAPDLAGSIGGGALADGGAVILLAARPPGAVSGDYDLFMADYSSGTISKPRRNPASSAIYWDAQPALSPDGSALYFSSDRRGTSGGTDIFVVRRSSGGVWSAPVNVGAGVNTACDELSPFVSGDGKWLYFSSAGHSTVGGYDLFRAPIRGDQIGTAENLGRPINTPADELFPSSASNADPDTLLYYSSNQKGSEAFDIYVLHRLPRRGPPIASTETRTVTLRGTVRNADGRPIDSALVRLEQRDPPGDKDSTLTSRDGGYRFEVEEGRRYELLAGSDSTLYVREEVRIPITEGRKQVSHDITLGDTVTFRVNFPFNNATDPYEFTLSERGLPSDLRWSEMIDKAAEFLRRFNGTPGLRFEIVGHTDPVGSDAFNLDLGQRRAEFIRRELVGRGVNAELLGVYSRGEGQPLPRYTDEAEAQFHARLRRVELIRKKK